MEELNLAYITQVTVPSMEAGSKVVQIDPEPTMVGHIDRLKYWMLKLDFRKDRMKPFVEEQLAER